MKSVDLPKQLSDRSDAPLVNEISDSGKSEALHPTSEAVAPRQGTGNPQTVDVQADCAQAEAADVESLTEIERAQLQEYESTIRNGCDAIYASAIALKAIHDLTLFREFKTFPAYCRAKWGFRRSAAYQRLELAQANEDLSAMADKAMLNERQARALAGLTAEEQTRVWKDSCGDRRGTATYPQRHRAGALACWPG